MQQYARWISFHFARNVAQQQDLARSSARRARFPRNGKVRQGYSLTELLVVLAILALIAAASTPFLPRDRQAGKGFAEELEQMCRRTQALALRAGRPVLLRFDTDAREVRADGLVSLKAPAGVTFTATGAARESTRGQIGVRFFPQGGSTGGRVDINWPGQTAQMTIQWLTGGCALSEPRAP